MQLASVNLFFGGDGSCSTSFYLLDGSIIRRTVRGILSAEQVPENVVSA